MRPGLVLGAGAAKGIAHIGVLLALEDLGIEPAFVGGCSMGALIGGLYAGGISPRDQAEIARKVDVRQTARLLAPQHLPSSGITDGGRVTAFLRSFLGDQRIEDLPRPYYAVAVDLTTGTEVVLQEGDLVTAIRASIGIPGLFTPVVTKRYNLVDGGVLDPVPVAPARRLFPDVPIVAVNVLPRPSGSIDLPTLEWGKPLSVPTNLEGLKTYFRIRRERELSLISVLLRASTLMQGALLTWSLRASPPDLLIEIPTEDVGAFEFHRGWILIERAYRITQKTLEGWLNGGR